jgi:phosphatidylglycerophosphate synthase
LTSGVTPTGAARSTRARPPGSLPATAAGRAATQRDHRTSSVVVSAAVVLATAAADDGLPAAALPWGGGTLLQRLLGQLAELGIEEAHVVSRPGCADALDASLAGLELAVQLHSCANVVEDLRTVASLARAGDGPLVVAQGEVVTHGEALAGLLADPRVATGILTSTRRAIGGAFPFRTRSVRGRVVSAASPYHSVQGPNAKFLGLLKVAAADRGELAAVAERLAAMSSPPISAPWREELSWKERRWRVALASSALARARHDEPPSEDDDPEPEPEWLDPEGPPAPLSADDEAELSRRLAAAPDDVSSLLLVGLVRAGGHVGVSHLRKLFWARPLSRDAVERAAAEITEYDEDRVLLDSAVKASDGFFTTFFVSPYSKYIARWAARRGLTPNAVTTVSLAIGVVAALAFATGERAGLIVGAILVQLSFTTDCVDGQLARYTRTFSQLGAWLDSIFDRTKEYAVFAGLAIGASRAGDDVWLLAASALALQTARHAIDFSYPTAQHQALASAWQPPLEQPQDSAGAARAKVAAEAQKPERRGFVANAVALWRFLDRRSAVRWVKKMIAFPIGERFAVISLTAALATPRTTFVVLLAWGGFAGCYIAAGRVLRSVYR